MMFITTLIIWSLEQFINAMLSVTCCLLLESCTLIKLAFAMVYAGVPDIILWLVTTLLHELGFERIVDAFLKLMCYIINFSTSTPLMVFPTPPKKPDPWWWILWTKYHWECCMFIGCVLGFFGAREEDKR